MPNPKVEWKRVGTPVIYEAVCPVCGGSGEERVVFPDNHIAIEGCFNCTNRAYSFPTKKGHIYETRYE